MRNACAADAPPPDSRRRRRPRCLPLRIPIVHLSRLVPEPGGDDRHTDQQDQTGQAAVGRRRATAVHEELRVGRHQRESRTHARGCDPDGQPSPPVEPGGDRTHEGHAVRAGTTDTDCGISHIERRQVVREARESERQGERHHRRQQDLPGTVAIDRCADQRHHRDDRHRENGCHERQLRDAPAVLRLEGAHEDTDRVEGDGSRTDGEPHHGRGDDAPPSVDAVHRLATSSPTGAWCFGPILRNSGFEGISAWRSAVARIPSHDGLPLRFMRGTRSCRAFI